MLNLSAPLQAFVNQVNEPRIDYLTLQLTQKMHSVLHKLGNYKFVISCLVKYVILHSDKLLLLHYTAEYPINKSKVLGISSYNLCYIIKIREQFEFFTCISN